MSKKMLSLIVAGILTLGIEGGCSHNKNHPEIEYISLPGGYITTKDTLKILNPIAGIHAGTMQFGFMKLKDGEILPITKGEYDMKKYPRSMIRVAETADKDSNRVIDYTEARDLRNSFYNSLIELYLEK